MASSIFLYVTGTYPGFPVGVADGGTGTSTQFTPGSVVFASTLGVYGEDNASFFYNDTLNNVGIGTAVPTARLHLGAGTNVASTAPLKLTSGTSLTTPEAGAIEFTTDTFSATITTGAARKGIVLNDGTALTSGKIPIASTGGRLIDGQTPLAGVKVYYVSDSSGGAVTRKLTFTAGILTAET